MAWASPMGHNACSCIHKTLWHGLSQWTTMHARECTNSMAMASPTGCNACNIFLRTYAGLVLLSLRLTVYIPCRAVPMHIDIGTSITRIVSLAKSYTFEPPLMMCMCRRRACSCTHVFAAYVHCDLMSSRSVISSRLAHVASAGLY